MQPLDLDNLFLFNDGTYSGLQAYKNSKLANVLFAYELNRQLDGTGVKVNAVDPGRHAGAFCLLTFRIANQYCKSSAYNFVYRPNRHMTTHMMATVLAEKAYKYLSQNLRRSFWVFYKNVQVCSSVVWCRSGTARRGLGSFNRFVLHC